MAERRAGRSMDLAWSRDSRRGLGLTPESQGDPTEAYCQDRKHDRAQIGAAAPRPKMSQETGDDEKACKPEEKEDADQACDDRDEAAHSADVSTGGHLLI